jgi:hypothetical protein
MADVIFWYLILCALALAAFIPGATYFLRRNIQQKQRIKRAITTVLFLVTVPKETLREEEKAKPVQEMVGVAEQLFASLYSIYQKGKFFTGQEHLALEIVNDKGTISFYVSAPLVFKDLVQKQINSFYPSASIEEVEEHNFFRKDGYNSAAEIVLQRSFIYPIKTYKALESDPLNALTNALFKLGEDSGGAIQIMIRPRKPGWQAKVNAAVKAIQEGRLSQVSATSFGLGFSTTIRFIGDIFRGFFVKPEQTKPTPTYQLTPIQEETVKALTEKASQVGFETLIRVVTSSPTQQIADVNLTGITSAFQQFNAPHLNGFRVIRGRVDKIVTDFIFRYFLAFGRQQILTPSELASLFHFPNYYTDTPNIRWLLAKKAPAPADLPSEGTFMGENVFRGETRPVFIKAKDRRQHIYAIGQTGTGKTTFLKNLIMSDIKAGNGVCVIDPHGDLVEDILMKIPKERAEDVIYFDPGDLKRPMGFNLLEYKTKEQKDFLVQEVVNIFYKLFGTEIIGPKFEHWARNAALTLMEQPEGGTLIEIPRLFSDESFQAKKVANVTDPVVRAFWEKEMAATSEFHKSEMLGYFVSKFGRFLTNEMMRNIIGQGRSSFDLREVMDQGKILLCNLSKGRMGEVNSALMGMILVSKIQMSAMARVDTPEDLRRDFYLYVDEFQNFTTDSFATILSEARKYHLNLTVAHQFIEQLEEKTRDAVFGNVGTLVIFRSSPVDAELLEKYVEPVFSSYDLVNVENLNCFVRLLIDGVASKAFSMRIPFEKTPKNEKIGEAIRQLSRLKFGRDKQIVEKEVYERTKIE